MNSHPETTDNFRLNNSDDKERKVSFEFNQEMNECFFNGHI